MASVTGDGLASLGEEHQPRPAVARVWAALYVAHVLELLDRLGHGLLAHAGKLSEFRDSDALRRHEWEHVRVRRAEVVEARSTQRVDVLRVVLVYEAQQEPDQRAGGKSASIR